MKTIIINNYRPKPKLCFSFMKIHENIYLITLSIYLANVVILKLKVAILFKKFI